MLKNYWKIAWRNLVKDRRFTVLNLLGLSIGLACALLIGLWIADEWHMEKYNANDARLYQVMTNMQSVDGITTGSYTPGIMAPALKAEFPEVEYASSVLESSWFNPGGVVSFDDKKLKAQPQYVDSGYFHIFSCPFVQSDYSQLFIDKQGVAISTSFATAMFGTTQNLIGKVIHYDRYEFTGDYVIRGIFEPNPKNATEQFDLLFNYAVCFDRRPGLKEWWNQDPNTFLLLKPGADIAHLNGKLANFIREKGIKGDDAPKYFLTQFSGRYLYNRYENGVQAGGRITYVRLFSIIALFILVIACINFMNLSTARATHRAKEVGIQKVVGAGRLTLIGQYLGESLLITLFSLALALVLVAALLPVFNGITGKQLILNFDREFLLVIVGMTVLTGLIAGSYPAFYLSAFRPVAVLKGTIKTSVGELWARKGLVVFQFTLSVMFIAGVLVVYRQVSYIQSRDLGYDRERIIHFNIPIPTDSLRLLAASTFVKELGNIPGVAKASSYGHNLMGDHGEIGGLHWPGKDPNLKMDFANIEVGYNFLETVGIKLKAGRNFSQNANAEHEIILNETAIKAMGLKDPIGKVVTFWDERRVIVGVAADFNYESLYQPVKPAFFRSYPVNDEVMAKLAPGSGIRTIAAVKAAYARFNPGMAFEYNFMDEDYQRLYASEIRVGILSRYFAGLAILISCLGLFGLAAFTAQRRKKEIGIRKVVGASVTQLVFLLSKEFLGLVLLAIGIAVPLAWLGMHEWLDQFAYRVPLTPGIFGLTGLAAIVITLLTISYQSISAAMSNPVHSLRSE
jgi:ABC-type antimicrobial peptide transport system permease subunit